MPYLRRSPLLALAAAACVFCGAAEPPAKPTKEQIAQWVKQLGDDDFSTREEATQKLYEAGQTAEEALQEAARNDDAEVARRARTILDKFKWGLYPDAPRSVVDLVNRYRAADVNGKQAVVKELLDAGPPGYRTLLRIAGAESDATVRGVVLAQVTRELAHTAPQMLADGNDDALALLLDILVADDARQGASHYAAFWLMRGKLDERIAHFKALAVQGTDAPHNWEVVAHLCHAKGDLAAAREAADKAEKPELAEAMLAEAGDWKALTDRPARGPAGRAYEEFALRASYRRRAGDTTGFDDALTDLRKLADAAPQNADIRFQFAKVLFFNDRPNDAVEVLTTTPGRQADAFEMLVAQVRVKEALALADKAKADNAPEAAVLEILKARTLYTLGEKEKAKDVFARYAAAIQAGSDAWVQSLIDSENRVGLRDEAFEHAAKWLAAPKVLAAPHGGWATPIFAKLYPKNTDTAAALWMILRGRPTNGEPVATMKDLRALLDGTADPKLLKEVADRALVLLMNPSDPDEIELCLAAAEATLACKNETLARSLLEKAGSADALIRLGDLDAEKKEWDKAEKWYAQAWAKDQTRPLALFLDGYALAQAGQEAEGKKRMELAHWTPLGDSAERFTLLQALSERGLREGTLREAELLQRLSQAGTLFASQGQRVASLGALDRKDYVAAADGQERSMMRCLSRDVRFIQPLAYLTVPALVHYFRAQSDVAAGKIDEARKEADLGLAALPADPTFPIAMVPALEKAGRKKEAQELFDQCLAVQENLCKEYPNSTGGHNGAAWLSACCGRNLESAQEHALKAVALAPTSPGVFDTLAEVYFQRGDKDKAIETQKKAVELDPKRTYYRKQLRRMEAGDPTAERPPENDE